MNQSVNPTWTIYSLYEKSFSLDNIDFSPFFWKEPEQQQKITGKSLSWFSFWRRLLNERLIRGHLVGLGYGDIAPLLVLVLLLTTCYFCLSRSETRPPEDDEEEEEEILGSDDDEQEDPKDYVKGKKSKSQAKIGDGNLQPPF